MSKPKPAADPPAPSPRARGRLPAGLGAVLLWSCLALYAVAPAAALRNAPVVPQAQSQEVPRVVVALYDARRGPVYANALHRYLEMPANHLGLVFEFHDLSQPLPDLTARADVRGIVLWQRSPDIADPDAFLAWLATALDAGKRLLLLGDLVAATDRFGRYVDRGQLDRVLRHVGVAVDESGAAVGADARIVSQDGAMVGFERKLVPPLPYFVITHAIDGATSYLRVRPRPGADATADLVVSGAAGAYVATDYVLYRGAEVNQRQWLVDPFALLRAAFATDDLPKPDTTTLSGRRIYYSHIDGDGWRNVSLADEYQGHDIISARVVLEEIIRPHPELPVTVSPITADLDPDWYGDQAGRATARDIFALPQVELGSHTHTHPFAWGFFEHYDPAQEAPYLPRYEKMNGGRFFGWEGLEQRHSPLSSDEDSVAYNAAYVPRAFALRPFDLDLEVQGSIDIIEQLAPPGKRVTVMQWSGDTLPFPAIMAATRQAGLRNINGGDSRFDDEFPSYAFVAPVGRRVGDDWQVFASNSNENTYTDLWRSRYFAFRFLPETFERTESPRRVRAANLYYHMYSGERQASLKALLENLRWVGRHALAPIETSRFAAIGSGFFTTRLLAAGPSRWTVHARQGLQTLRFDAAGGLGVDWARSTGVIGQRHYQGSLYVALDEAVETPAVAVTTQAAVAAPLYLVESRWRVYDVTRGDGRVSATAAGYGSGEMCWQGAAGGHYGIAVERTAGARRLSVVADRHGRLDFDLGPSPFVPLRFTIERTTAAPPDGGVAVPERP